MTLIGYLFLNLRFENLNTILSVFGIVAIPASLIQLFQFFTEESPVWQRIIIIIVLGFFLGMFLFGWFRRITKKNKQLGETS